MTKRRLAAYLDALADGKRPDSFDVDPEDVDVLRTAISLRSARPGDAVPDDGFVDRLYEELALGRRRVSYREILTHVRARPELSAINADGYTWSPP